MEYFTDQQEIKTKTKNWCYKLQQTGVLSEEQLAQCINTFKDTTNGLLPKEFISPPSGLDRNYSLYNTKHQSTLSSKINADTNSNNNNDNNSNSIMLTSSNDDIIACNTKNTIYTVSNINDPSVKQNELYFILDKQASNTEKNIYSIISPYGNFLTINRNLEVSFNGISPGPATQWNIIKINNSNNTNDNTVMIEPLQYINHYLIYDTALQKLSAVYGISDTTEWVMTSKSSGSNSDDNGDNGDNVDKTDNSIVNKYKTSNTEMIYNIYDINIKKICIEELIKTYTLVKTQINTQYTTIIQLIKDTYESIATLNNKTDIIITCENLANIQLTLTTNIDTKFIKPLTTLLDEIIEKEKTINYNDYISNLQIEYETIENSIKQSTIIIDRQLQSNNTLNNDYNDNNIKDKHLQNVDNVISVNSDIVNNMTTQDNYALKLYPLFILVLIILLIYLIYTTSQKFVNNIL